MSGRIYIDPHDWREKKILPVLVVGGNDDSLVHQCVTSSGHITLPDDNQTEICLAYGGLAKRDLLAAVTRDAGELAVGDLVVREFD